MSQIMSYGKLKDGLSKEDFFEGVSDPVNRELMDIFVQCDIVDRSGHGVPKVVKVYGREAFRFLENGILVTIPFDREGFSKANEADVKNMTDSIDANKEKQDNYLGHDVLENVSDNVLEKESGKLTDTERKILQLLASGISENKRISDETGLTTRTVGRILKKLSEKGIVTRIGSDRKGYWIILRK